MKSWSNKRLVLILLIGFIFVLLLIFFYMQVKENRRYETFLSEHLRSDIYFMGKSLEYNGMILEEILRTNRISQTELLTTYYKNISDSYSKYANMAIQFHLIPTEWHHDMQYNYTAASASSIFLVFAHWERDILELTPKQREVLTHYQALNDRWLKAMTASPVFEIAGDGRLEYSEEYKESWRLGLFDPYWMEILLDLESATKDYLESHELEKLGDLWLD